MKNTLKALFRRNQLTVNPDSYNSQVIIKGNKGVSDIVDELLTEGVGVNRETILDIIARFNQKSADLVLSGYNVDNGLVNMSSSLRGPLYQGKWNPNVNWVDVTITPGKDMFQAAAETTVEIIDEKNELLDNYNLSNQKHVFAASIQNKIRNVEMNEPRHKIVGEPACGIAFRRWLCKA